MFVDWNNWSSNDIDIFSKLIHMTNCVLPKSQQSFYKHISAHFNFVWKGKGYRIAKTIQKKMVDYSPCWDFLYSYSNQDCVVLVEGRYIDQWTEQRMRNKSTQIGPVIFDNGAKAIQGGRLAFSQMVLQQLESHTQKKRTLT